MEVHLSDELYERFRELIGGRSGLSYPPHKRADLAHGLSRALAACRLPGLEELYQAVCSGGQAWEELLAELTIGETYFFRNGPQFAALRDHILPEIIGRRAGMRSLRIWSAGCATGEEPYSLAMLLDEILPDRASWQVTILATDINPRFLERAREGLYGEWSFRETSAPRRARFFTPEGSRWRLKPQIRQAVQFAPLNLVAEGYPSIANGTCALDLVLCRNVTIYFAEATTRAIAQRMYGALSPGGWLVVGHAEPQAGVYAQFDVQNFPETVVYRKSLSAPLFAFDASRGTFTAGAQPILTVGGVTAKAHLSPGSAATTPATPRPREREGLARLATPAPRQQVTALPTSWSAIAARAGQGDKAGAAELARSLVAREPDHVEALILLAQQGADEGNWEEARRYCERALAREPLAIAAHYTLGLVCEHQGRPEEALATFRRSVYLDRSFVPGLLGMAAMWRRLGHAAEAQRAYRAAERALVGRDPAAKVEGASGATVAEVLGFVRRQLNPERRS
jgi:chemotaxis protein methyltransferase CheR